MKELWAAAVAAGLGLSAHTAAAAAASGCQYIRVTELPLKFEGNQPFVQVSINGRPAWFVIDTGSVTSVLFGGATRAFGLKEMTADGVTFYGVGGNQEGKYAIVARFGIGEVTGKDIRFYSIGHEGAPDRAGVLGREFIDQLGDPEFDLAAGALRIWKAQGCPADASLAYWTKTPRLARLEHYDFQAPYTVKLKVNGWPVDAQLDSGAYSSTIVPAIAAIAAIVGVRKEQFDNEVKKIGGVGDYGVESRIATFDTVDIGDEQIKHARLRVADMFARNVAPVTGSILPQRVIMADEPKMLLGGDFLRAHRVLIATSQHLLYFSYNGGPIFQIVGDPVKPKDEATAAPPPK